MTRAAWRKMLLAEQGPVSRFVRGMRGFQFVPWAPGSGVLAVLFVCGPEKPGGGHSHYQVSPFPMDGTRPRWGG